MASPEYAGEHAPEEAPEEARADAGKPWAGAPEWAFALAFLGAPLAGVLALAGVPVISYARAGVRAAWRVLTGTYAYGPEAHAAAREASIPSTTTLLDAAFGVGLVAGLAFLVLLAVFTFARAEA